MEYCWCSDTGDKFTEEVDVVYPQGEYVMDRLHKKKPIHFGTRQEGGQIQTYVKASERGSDMTLVTSALEELDITDMSVLNTV